MRTKKNLIANTASHQNPAVPRLRKAGEEPVQAQTAKPVEPVKKTVVKPALNRTPRDAREARNMFEALFSPAAA